MNEVIRDRFKTLFTEEDQERYIKAIELLEISRNTLKSLNKEYGCVVNTHFPELEVNITVRDELKETIRLLDEAWYNVAGFVDDDINI
jgi:hypothetical protein